MLLTPSSLLPTRSPDLVPPGHLATISARLARGDAWKTVVSRPPVGRRWTQLLDHPDISAWLISWAPGSGLALHDHGDASAGITVVEGELHERYIHLDLTDFRARDLDVGSTVGLGPDHVHEVVNRTRSVAISIHVYSPNLDRMTFYDRDPIPGSGRLLG